MKMDNSKKKEMGKSIGGKAHPDQMGCLEPTKSDRL